MYYEVQHFLMRFIFTLKLTDPIINFFFIKFLWL
jgi:hypothetical protein